MAVPPRTPQQRLDALAKAHATRTERAALKRQLRTGELTLADVFHQVDVDPTGTAARTRPLELVRCIKGYRTTHQAQALLHRCAVAVHRRMRGLGPHQREALIAATEPSRSRG